MKRNSIAFHERSGPLAPRILLVIVSLLMVPVVSFAAEVTGSSGAYLLSRQEADESKALPLFEYLNFSVQDGNDSPFSAHIGGWGRFDFESSQTNLQYGYVSYRRATDNTGLDLGRIMIFDGVARELIDGGSARTDLRGGFSLSAFYGIPVETGIEAPSYLGNNVIYGGRAAHQVSGIYTIGLSYLKEEKSTEVYREEQGIDVWISPFGKMAVIGRSSYNAVTDGWMEHSYALTLGPFYRITLGADIAKVSYKDLFSSVTANPIAPGSVFKVVDLKETMTAAGGSAAIAVTDHLALSAEYRNYDFDIAGPAVSYGGKVALSYPGMYEVGGGYRRMNSDASKQLRYSEYRIYAFEKYRKMDFGVDFLNVVFDQKINGVGAAMSTSLVAGYELSAQARIGADVEYAENPDFDQDVRALIKFLYKFGKGA